MRQDLPLTIALAGTTTRAAASLGRWRAGLRDALARDAEEGGHAAANRTAIP